MTIPTFLPYFVFVGTAATVIAILYGLHRSLVEAGWPAADRARTFRASSVILLGWLAVTVALGALGVYHVDSTEIPTIQYGILLPISIGALLIWRSETAKSLIAAVPQPWLVGVQLYRALGVIFLILYATGKLPACSPGLPASATSPSVSWRLSWALPMRGRRARPRASWRRGTCSAFSISSIAVGTGFATAPSLIQPIEVQPTSELMTVLPMVLIPVYLVPLSIVLHLASLAKLRREAVAGNGFGRPVAA